MSGETVKAQPPVSPTKPKAASVTSDGFDEAKFMKELLHLRDTQESIQALSVWCLKMRKHAYKIARCWLKIVKRVKVEHKLALTYLLNDVVQHSKRKNWTDVLQKFRGALKEAMPHLKDVKICDKIFRVLSIWREREVFDDKFIGELEMCISDPADKSCGDNKYEEEIVDNFQPNQLITQLKILKALEDDTEYKQKMAASVIESANYDAIFNVPVLKERLKDRASGQEHVKNFDDSRKRVADYIKSAERELAKRRNLIDLLSQGCKFYASLAKEATIVATAYNNFGQRVDNLSVKLSEHCAQLRDFESRVDILDDISPVGTPPSPSAHVPSPTNDDHLELVLPDEERRSPRHKKRRKRRSKRRESESFATFLTRLAAGEARPDEAPAANDLEDIDSSDSDNSDSLLDTLNRQRRETVNVSGPGLVSNKDCLHDSDNIPLLSSPSLSGINVDNMTNPLFSGALSFVANTLFGNATNSFPSNNGSSIDVINSSTSTTLIGNNTNAHSSSWTDSRTANGGQSHAIIPPSSVPEFEDIDDDDLESTLYYSGARNRIKEEVSKQTKSFDDMDMSDGELEAGQISPDDGRSRPRMQSSSYATRHESKSAEVTCQMVPEQSLPPPPPPPLMFGEEPPPPPPLGGTSVAQLQQLSESPLQNAPFHSVAPAVGPNAVGLNSMYNQQQVRPQMAPVEPMFVTPPPPMGNWVQQQPRNFNPSFCGRHRPFYRNDSPGLQNPYGQHPMQRMPMAMVRQRHCSPARFRTPAPRMG